MKAKMRKPFGIWALESYRAQISTNKRLYRTVYNHALKHLKKKHNITIVTILKTLGVTNIENTRRGFYRSSWGRKFVSSRHFL